jgi:predicted nucleotidyltransferase
VDEKTARLRDTVRKALRDRTDVHLAVLFGSRARGKARPGSDLDLGIQGDGLDRLALARDLSLATGLEVDVVDLSTAGYPLLKAILRDGVFVHQGRKGAAGTWLSHTFTEVETFRPCYERMRDAYLRKLARGAHG